MQPVSARFLGSLRHGHRVQVTATIYQPGEAGVAVPIEGGQVQLDRSAQLRRQATVDVPWAPGLPPELSGVAIDLRNLPFGSYIDLRRGIMYPDGTSELVQLGFLRIESVTWATAQARATLTCSERMAQVRDELLMTPYAPNGLLPSAAARALVEGVFAATIAYDVTAGATETAMTDVTFDRDRAEAIASLATGAGCEAYFDAAGNFVYRPLPTGATPDWTVDAGPGGVLVDAGEALDRTATYNGVFVRGQAAANEPPLTALVVDDDPASPTLWGGPFGKVVRIEESTAVQTVAQAQAAAAALLESGLGLSRALNLTAVPNPALEPGDRVQVVFPDGRSELHVLDALRISLDPIGAVEAAAHARYETAGVASFVDAEAWRELEGASA
jgi:hypothetical protein